MRSCAVQRAVSNPCLAPLGIVVPPRCIAREANALCMTSQRKPLPFASCNSQVHGCEKMNVLIRFFRGKGQVS